MSEVKDLEPVEDGADPGRGPREPSTDEMEVEILSFGDADDAAASAGSAAPETAESPAERELAELRERHLRLRADFENFKKRMEREREERVRHAVADTVRELLPVADNLSRALAAEGGIDDLRRGVEMIARQLADTLRRLGVEEIPSLGQPFDPRLHEAVSREESAEVDAPTVVAEMQRGYLHGERLLRPAMVRVAMPATAEGATARVDGEGRPAAEDER